MKTDPKTLPDRHQQQFSASADPGSRAKRGEVNQMQSINSVATAIAMGASFAARSFSGDREQLVSLIKTGIVHTGCALIDVISPCVTFNDQEGSTKSYAYTREHLHRAVEAGLVPPAKEITADYAEGESTRITLHDGSSIVLRKAGACFDPTQRNATLSYLEKLRSLGEISTGLLFIDESLSDMHTIAGTAKTPLRDIALAELILGSAALAKLQRHMR